MKVEYWPHKGSFKESKKNKKAFNSLIKALEFVVSSASVLDGVPAFSMNDIYIKHYGYDSRLENECFMVCIGKHSNEDYIKRYGHPMCRGYLYFDELKGAPYTWSTLSGLELKTLLANSLGVQTENIEIFKEYCHFVNLDLTIEKQGE